MKKSFYKFIVRENENEKFIELELILVIWLFFWNVFKNNSQKIIVEFSKTVLWFVFGFFLTNFCFEIWNVIDLFYMFQIYKHFFKNKFYFILHFIFKNKNKNKIYYIKTSSF